MERGEPVHAVRTLKALELVCQGLTSLEDLSVKLEVHPRTARRLMSQLVSAGYVVSVGDEELKFQATLKLVTLAGIILERTDLVRVAGPFVAHLHAATGEASQLCVPQRLGGIHLMHEFGERITENLVVVRTRLGEVVPYHSTAHGQALLAYLPSQVELIVQSDLQRFTERTITNPSELLAELARIRERGYAVCDREHNDEVCAVAAPVFSVWGELVAALGISAPAGRLPEDKMHSLGEPIVSIAGELSKALGHEEGGPAAFGQLDHGVRLSKYLRSRTFL
jgi:DNA-binding IclR family transcriptional regulator